MSNSIQTIYQQSLLALASYSEKMYSISQILSDRLPESMKMSFHIFRQPVYVNWI
ncbi:hypothetical protein [Stenoxybacter acetivorans]|uniref:hypothetical protein n=1 Tax=Stenoxybacter acetivorans TaxID=422441 RepID=UPI0012EC0A97|nr:hypothetical protein [Stenoxybacter acetivorans]